jgi:hypothetical protein
MKNDTANVAQLGSWYAVAAVAAASFGLAGGAQEADAAQVVVYPVGGPVMASLGPSCGGSAGAVYFNLLDKTGSQVGKFVPFGSPGNSADLVVEWDRSSKGTHVFAVGKSSSRQLVGVLTTSPYSSHIYAAKLHRHAPINSSTFETHGGFFSALLGSSYNGNYYGKWKPGHTGYLGLEVVNFTSVSVSVIFGWAKIQLGSGSNAYDPTLLEWGFNDTPFGTAYAGIGTPAPEPSSLLLLASGAAGLAAYRRRSKQRQAA